MTQLHAQPYDISANGFFFESAEEYAGSASQNHNEFGFPVEEYEIQFIDGEDIDAQLFSALGVHQGTFPAFLDACDAWDDLQKQKVIIAAGECGYRFTLGSDDPEDFDVDIYPVDSIRALADYFLDEGLFGDIPERLQYYIDTDAIARDLSLDYSEITIAGERLVYRCG